MRKFTFTICFISLFAVKSASAQIGIGTATPNPAAQLDVSSTNKGLLMPRVALTSDTSWLPLPSAPTDGMILYNTASAGSGAYAVSPGFYYWTNSMWIPVGQTPVIPPAFQVTALNCQAATPASGTYEQTTPVNASNTKLITVTVNAAGAYNFSTNTVAGITFNASGTFTAGQAGTPQNILLQASGTPTSAGLKTFIVTAGAQVCTFNINFTAPATFNCAGITNTMTQAILVSGNSYSGTVTVPYTAGNSSSYPATSITANGLTLTRTAGTYLTGGGNVLYTLSGTYAGTGGAVSFTLPESGCTVYTGGATYNVNSLTCGNTPAGTYTINVPMTASNTKTISFTANTIGYYSASTNTVNGVNFSGSGFIGNIGFANVTLTATGTPIAAGTYNYTVTAGGQSCTFPVTFTGTATFNCANITTTFSGNLVNGTSYSSSTVTEPYTAGNNSAYGPLSVGPVNGLTLSAPSGSYAAAGGSIIYTISGTYTGTGNGTITFAFPESGCSITLGSATYTAGTINCNGTLIGSYVAGIPMTGSNIKNISITSATTGGYSVSTTANGVTFSGSGIISTAGIQTLALTASGTPLSAGNFTYTVNLGGQTCTYTVNYITAASAVCAGITNTVDAPLTNGTAYNDTITVPYVSGNGIAYGNYVVGPSNGLTLTRIPGTYATGGSGSGNVLYLLTGTFTGTTNNSQSFSIPEGCTVTVGQPHLIANSLSCGGALNGTFQVGISATGNTKVIGFANLSAGTYSISSSSLAGISFSATVTLPAPGSQAVTLIANGTSNSTGTFNFTVTVDGQTCTFPVTIQPVATVNCANIVNGLPQGPLVSGTSYTGTVSEPYTAGNGQAYTTTTLNSNGVTLTRVAGTYVPGGGTVVYNIGGTYNSTLNYISFTLPENNCLVSNGAATLGGNTLNCSGAAFGNYFVGVPMNSGNTKSVSFTPVTAGIVSCSTNTVNGITFIGPIQGVSGGSGLTMTASGTPIAAGTFNYTVTVAGQNCSFPITFTAPATFNCAALTNTLTGPLVNGTPYTGTVAVPYTGGSNGTYSSSTAGPVNGLTLTNSGGTYSGSGGNITYSISGTYTGGSAATTFTLPETGCTVTFGAATFTGNTLNCGGTLSGTYQNQVAATAANTKQVTVDVATTGSYNFTTTTSLGYTFSASGMFTSTGPQTVTLTASGTGNGSGTGNYTLNIGNQSCTFTVTVVGTLIINCGAIIHNLPASLVNGNTYSATVNIPYTTILTGSYPTAIVSSTGLLLTRTAGTYSSSGTIVYNLSGIFTGTTGTSVNFTLPESGCVVSAGGANYAALSVNCNGTQSGNYVQNTAMTAANTKAITINVLNPGPWSVTTPTVNGVAFFGTGSFGGTGTQTALLTGSGTPAATGTFNYPVSLAGQGCSFNITYNALSANCSGIVNTMPTYLVNGTTYNIGSVSLPFTAGNGTAYGVTTVGPNSGLTLTRVAGTYDAGGGTVVYNLSGVYSGAAGATVGFSLPEGCSVTAGASTYNSPDCSGPLAGVYQAGLAVTASNTKMIDLNFSAPGFYSINIAAQNSVNFIGSGYVTTAGVHTITLTANGTPLNTGTFTYTFIVGTQGCSFQVTYAPPATFNCSSINGFPPYQAVNGATYSATVNVPYTSGNGSTYSALSLLNAGLTLARTAGTFSGAGGIVVYTLSGIFTGGSAIFTLPESGCILTIGGIQYLSPTVSCAGALAGSYVSGTAMTSANTKTININVSVPGLYVITSTTANGVTFAGSGVPATTGLQDIQLTASGLPSAPGTYYYTVNVNGQTCNFGVTYQ